MSEIVRNRIIKAQDRGNDADMLQEVDTLIAKVTALEAENGKLKAPVSEQERTAILLALHMYRQQENSNATSRIDDIERIIVSRQPSPAAGRSPAGDDRMTPIRIQRRRTRGWTAPKGAVNVTRPGKWGNPFKIGRWYAKGDVFVNENPPRPHSNLIYGEIQIGNRKPRRVYTCVEREPRSKRFTLITNASEAVEWYRWYVTATNRGEQIQNELRGKDLMCWCPPGQPCHADVLLEIANQAHAD